MTRKLLGQALFAATLMLPAWVASAAGAKTTCTLSGTDLSITATGDAQELSLSRSGDQIAVDGTPCAGATVNNVDRIVVTEQTDDGGMTLVVDLSGGPLGPGATGETTGESDIEIVYEFGAEGDNRDEVSLVGSTGADSIAIGSDGIALNADDDVDLTFTGDPPSLRTAVHAGGGDDTVTAQGGAGAGGPFAYRVKIFGGNGADSLFGGDGNDLIEGGNDDDSEHGGAGNDRFQQGVLGNGWDLLDGGEGSDFADYLGKGVPVSISADDVANDGEAGEKDNLTAIEAFQSCDGPDTLLGSDGDDKILGKGGSDDVSGSAGADTLKGGNNSDSVLGGEGDDLLVGGFGKDKLDGGPGNDTCIVFKGEKDRVISCEKVVTKRHR